MARAIPVIDRILNSDLKAQFNQRHIVQLYWLLMSFFSACAEVGAYPYVVCQE